MRARGLAGALVVVAVLAGTLAACGDDPPVTHPSPSTTSTSASPKPKPLSPEQTVRAWVRGYNHALRTGDRTAFDRLSSRSCKTCDNLVRPVAEAVARRGKIRGGDWHVDHIRASKTSARSVVFDAAITSDAGRTRRHSGDTFHGFSADHFLVELHLARNGARWQLKAILWLR